MERRGDLIVNDEEIRSINGGGRFDKIEVNSGGKLIIILWRYHYSCKLNICSG